MDVEIGNRVGWAIGVVDHRYFSACVWPTWTLGIRRTVADACHSLTLFGSAWTDRITWALIEIGDT